MTRSSQWYQAILISITELYLSSGDKWAQESRGCCAENFDRGVHELPVWNYPPKRVRGGLESLTVDSARRRRRVSMAGLGLAAGHQRKLELVAREGKVRIFEKRDDTQLAT
jgi:hypothetical protein